MVMRARGAYGHVDFWINNAAVTLFSHLEDGPLDEHKQVIETNLFGAIAPRTTERLLLDALRRFHVSDQREPVTQGNIYEPPTEPARTHGERPPEIGRLAFAAWAVGRFGRIVLESAARRVRRWTPRLARAGAA